MNKDLFWGTRVPADRANLRFDERHAAGRERVKLFCRASGNKERWVSIVTVVGRKTWLPRAAKIGKQKETT
jgi:hypothetical protein